MKFVSALLLLFSTVAVAESTKHPKIITEKQKFGNVTVNNYRIEGACASNQNIGCISIGKVKNTFTPPDLLKGAEACIAQGNYNGAVKLIVVANVYSNFDAQRVTDESAKDAGNMAGSEFFSKFATSHDFLAELKRESRINNPKAFKTCCDQIKKIGYPKYYPAYMILHGMRAFRGDPHKDALVKDFDAEAAWNKAMQLVGCPID
jgi:hypothetical protein